MKLALLLSRIVASDTLTILTRAVVDTGPVTVHGSVPSLAVLANSVVGNVAPPSVDKSIFTFPLTPLEDHEIVCDEPIAQLSAPFGELTVIDGPPGVIVKLTFEMSKKTLPTASTFILAVVVAVFGIANASVPSLGVLAANTVGKVCPPSVDRDILTLAQFTEPVFVLLTSQVMVWVDPPTQDTLVLGDETWNGPDVLVTVTVISVNWV